MKKLFLCHHAARVTAVRELAIELRLRGVAPWVAEDGGFQLGDDQEREARRVIRNECHGLLFYATPGAIQRDFIRRVELDEAWRRVARERILYMLRMRRGARFMITTVTDGVTFSELRAASIQSLGHDLSRHAGATLGDDGTPPIQHAEVARRVLRRRLHGIAPSAAISMQFSTRAPMPDDADDLLRIDAGWALEDQSTEAWARVASGLEDVKAELSRSVGRPLLRVHGSRHLSAAFLLGATFRRSSGFSLTVRARDGDWATNGPLEAVQIDEQIVAGQSEGLVIQLAFTDKDLTPAVDAYLAAEGQRPRILRLQSRDGQALTGAQGRYVASHVRSRVVALVGERAPQELLLFMAAPQALAVQLGHEWNELPRTLLHEFDGTRYHQSLRWSSPYAKAQRVADPHAEIAESLA